MLRDVDIEAPLADADSQKDYTGLKDMLGPGEKGKGRAGDKAQSSLAPIKLTDHSSKDDPVSSQPATPVVAEESATGSPAIGSKRRRQASTSPPPDHLHGPHAATPVQRVFMRSYDAASHNVASFLRGPALPEEAGETPRRPPAHRRRLHSPDRDEEMPQSGTSGPGSTNSLQMPALGKSERQISNESVQSSSTGSGAGSSVARTASSGAVITPPSESPVAIWSSASGVRTQHPGVEIFSAPQSSMVGGPFSFGSSPWTSASGPAIPPMLPPSFSSSPLFGGGPFGMPSFGPMTPARPVHAHAYITFGAGMRQRELDLYTSEHPLEGISGVTGERESGIVPYHMPS